MGWKETYKKQGGKKLLRQLWKGGAFFTALGEFLLLGKSRTALEILRLSAAFKTRKKLEKKYKKVLTDFDGRYDGTLPHEKSDKVWICWLQGMENAPRLVRRCFRSVQENMPDKEIILLTQENMTEYVQFPDFILEKWQKGIISNTHMTDLMRLELLIRYGGLWLDATVFCTDNRIPAYYFNSDLFLYQCLKPGRDGHANYVSSWLIGAKTNNKILMAARELCYAYWKQNDCMWDYFLLHDFLCIAAEYYAEDWKKIVPKDNATPHVLLLRLFEPYDENMYGYIAEQSPFHKLSYKFTDGQTEKKGTYYDVLFASEDR